MPAWCYILAILLLLILLVLFLPIFCRISYREKLTVYLEILCFRFRLYPEKAKKKQKVKEKHKKKKKASVKAPPKDASPFSQIGFILSILKEQYPRILTVVTMRLKRLHMTVGAEDASKTALLYGEASLALSAFLELLHGFCKFSEDKNAVSLTPDFLRAESSLDAVLLLHTNLFRALTLGLRLSFAFVKKKAERQKKAQESKQEK